MFIFKCHFIQNSNKCTRVGYRPYDPERDQRSFADIQEYRIVSFFATKVIPLHILTTHIQIN